MPAASTGLLAAARAWIGAGRQGGLAKPSPAQTIDAWVAGLPARLEALIRSGIAAAQQSTFLSTSFGITLPLMVLFVLTALANDLLTHTVRADRTLQLYASQTIANGQGPYAGYVIMHPPLAFIPGAVAIALGRLINMPDDVSVRFVLLAGALLSIWLAYHLGKNASGEHTVGVLTAACLGWNLVVSVVSTGEQIKLTVLPISLLMTLAIQQRRWFWAGIAAGFVTMTWAGAAIFIPIALVSAVLAWREAKARPLLYLLVGLSAALISMIAYLAATRTLHFLWQQYVMTIFTYVVNKLTGQGIYAEGAGVNNVLQNLQVSFADIVLLICGLAGFALYIWASWRRTGKPLNALLNPDGSVILLSVVFLFAQALLDFQSPDDIMPLVPFLAVLAAWFIWRLIIRAVPDETAAADPRRRVMLALGFVVILSVLRLMGVRSGNEIQRLSVAAEWFGSSVSEDMQVQALGNLTPIVLSGRQNATRVIHLGPKSLLAMESEGQTLDEFIASLEAINPAMVLLDSRNYEKPYLVDLYAALDKSYINMGGYPDQGAVYVRKGNAEAFLIGLGMQFAYDNPFVMDASLRASDTRQRGAVAAFEAAARGRGRDSAPLILLGQYYQAQEMGDEAFDTYVRASQLQVTRPFSQVALGNYYYAVGAKAEALKQYRRAFGERLETRPVDPRYLPRLLTPLDFRNLEHLLAVPLGDQQVVMGYDHHPRNPTANKEVTITLYWWTLQEAQSVGMVGLQWLTEDGTPIGEPAYFPMIWSPGYGTQWSYQLLTPEFEGDKETFRLQVQIYYPESVIEFDPDEDEADSVSEPFARIDVKDREAPDETPQE